MIHYQLFCTHVVNNLLYLSLLCLLCPLGDGAPAEHLEVVSRQFESTATRVRRKYFWQNIKVHLLPRRALADVDDDEGPTPPIMQTPFAPSGALYDFLCVLEPTACSMLSVVHWLRRSRSRSL